MPREGVGMGNRIEDLIAWGRGLPQLAVASLAMYGGAALLILIGVITWQPGKNPRWVLVGLLGVAVLFVVVIAVRGVRYTTTEALVMAAALLAVTGALTWTTDL